MEEVISSPAPSSRGGELLVSPSSIAVSGSRRVQLFNCSKERFDMLVGCLVERSVIPLVNETKDMVESFQKLAWLLEWCRMSRVPRLEIAAGDDVAVELNLRALIDTAKQCACCSKEDQFVTCAQCGVASWCSERCVRKNYEDHQGTCRGRWSLLPFFFVFDPFSRVFVQAGQAVRAYFGL